MYNQAEYTDVRTMSNPQSAMRDRTTLGVAQDVLEKELGGLADTISVLTDRLDGILCPEMEEAEKSISANDSPHNSRQQNILWSAVSSATESRNRLQRLIDRIDI